MAGTSNYNQFLMWIQSISTSKEDIIVVDGENVSKDDYRYITLSQLAVRRGNYESIIDNNSLHVSVSKHGTYWIMSNFTETDEVGRKIAFSVKIKANSLKDSLEILSNSLMSLNFHLKEEDIKLMESYKQPTTKKKGIILLLIIFVILCIYLTIKIINNNGN